MEAMPMYPPIPSPPRGTQVLVRNSLDCWSPGFQILDCRPGGLLLRRVSDGAILPRLFSPSDVRPI